ncbi:hypothetical protein H632_c85p0 [Helicosporidium sp. ATCC 50920]|nr:hypothetical protein H632_c85p0 [Helicosporidium sp. ATCC 50920]|eukprot:KDD76855.1 hypothetical protein H632_c85p0 [Helicosporidium sp. ATCC 50920]
MSNAPDRYEKFVVPEGVKKISFERDTKVTNAGTFTIQREDHTIGNAIRCRALEDKNVVFTGYKVPHPLEYQMLVKILTNGKKSPIQVMQESLQHISSTVHSIHSQFESEAQRIKHGEEVPY